MSLGEFLGGAFSTRTAADLRGALHLLTGPRLCERCTMGRSSYLGSVTLILVLHFAALPGNAKGQNPLCDLHAIREFTPSPSLSDQVTSVRVYGGWSVRNPPFLSGFSIQGDQIRVQLEASFLGPQAGLAFWEDALTLGVLSEGTYDVYVDVAVDAGSPGELTTTCGPTQQVVLASPQPHTDLRESGACGVGYSDRSLCHDLYSADVTVDVSKTPCHDLQPVAALSRRASDDQRPGRDRL